MQGRPERNVSAYRAFVREISSKPKNRGGIKSSRLRACASFRRLYESRDGRMCLFEDAAGHITTVRTSRFV